MKADGKSEQDSTDDVVKLRISRENRVKTAVKKSEEEGIAPRRRD